MTLTIEELEYGAEVGDLGIDAVRSVCAEALARRVGAILVGQPLKVIKSTSDTMHVVVLTSLTGRYGDQILSAHKTPEGAETAKAEYLKDLDKWSNIKVRICEVEWGLQ